ncbi:hypothetical protein O0I10_010448 [Lichtheimia ornata]|uniref:Secreted protein n=1 Tax=Lichtheimia ornata TaxID=688661 RepID=A0AAD7UVT2_9FUNG|nr:uncharacterized protein O0I10_010448 [Lichtheimia ornata]KAJ8653881.1 hypothetical protein O0I10_010448 [Lichtheimia ornata]
MSAIGKRLCLLVVSTFIASRVVGYQATGDFSEECPPMQVSCRLVSGLYQQQTTACISLVPYQPSSHHPSGASHYLQFGEPPETKVPYRSIMSATRSRFIPLASASFRSSRGSDYRQFL